MEIALQIDHRHRALKAQELLAFAERARSATKLRGTVTVLITSNEKLQALNRSFRGKDKPTDVLSFPTANKKVSGHSGDIAISAEIAIDNASRYGHTPADEVKILILHGMLHLAGHDHEADRGQMARLESKLRKSLRLPDSLIDRAHTSAKKSVAARKKPASRPQEAKMRTTKKSPTAANRQKASKRQVPPTTTK